MQSPIFFLAYAAPAILALTQMGAAPLNRACDTPALRNDTDLEAADPGVVPGHDVFHRDHEEYPFATFSIATRDPTSPGRVCFRYEIRDTGKDVIKSFRWKDIGLGFTDVDKLHPVRWHKNGFTKYDSVAAANTSVGAFERSTATTTALLPIEQADRDSSSRPEGTPSTLPLYKLTDQYPSTAEALAEAHIPPTPVLAVPGKIAAEISPLASRFQSGETELTIFTFSKFSGEFYFLETVIRINGPGRAEAELFAPALDGEKVIGEPINSDMILSFVARVRNRRHEKKALVDGGFISPAQLAAPKNPAAPAFFVVDYPLTIRTPEQSFCITVSGFSAYPINFDEWYCE